MLVIGIHHRHKRCGGGAKAFDRRAREAAATNALDHAHALVHQRKRARLVRRAIAAVIIDDDHFPHRRHAHRAVNPLDQRRKIAAFVERGQDDGEFKRHGRQCRPIVRGFTITAAGGHKEGLIHALLMHHNPL